MVTDLRNNEHLITIDMGKGIGLISGHTKKVGNTVGFRNSASNNGQTQGYRVYQPIVRNPQTAAQAEQRAKTAAINATYSHLKMIIDRGNESLPYGNRSRCAWLKKAFKAEIIPWFEKDTIPYAPVICPLTFGSLDNIDWYNNGDDISINAPDIPQTEHLEDIGGVSYWIKQYNPFLKDGDQLTFVIMGWTDTTLITDIFSFILDETSGEAVDRFSVGRDRIIYESPRIGGLACIIVSREGANGKHLRSSSSIKASPNIQSQEPYDDASKSAAIASYQTSQSANNDWQEDSQ